MKILHICLGAFYVDGFGYQENYLTKYHALSGNEVTIIASPQAIGQDGRIFDVISPSITINSDGIKVVRLSYRIKNRLRSTIKSYKGTYKAIDAEKPDIIFSHNPQYWDILEVAKYVKKHHNVKLIVDNHADYVNSARSWFSMNILHKILWKYVLKRVTPYVSQYYGVLPIRCDFLHDVYEIPSDRIKLLVMGVDDIDIKQYDIQQLKTEIRTQLGFSNDDFVIVSGGKIDRLKNTNLLLEAVRKINHPKLKLLLFGNPNPEIKDMIMALVDHPNIKYVGWTPAKEINKLLLISDLAVMPGTHSVLWEQIAGCGLPAFYKHYEGMHHVDVGGNCEFLYENSVEEIIGHILRVLSDKNHFDTLKKCAKEKAMPYFSYSSIAERSIQV